MVYYTVIVVIKADVCKINLIGGIIIKRCLISYSEYGYTVSEVNTVQ